MNCPNCGKRMEERCKRYYSLGAWDMDYPDAVSVTYKCKNCNIVRTDGKWKIPKEYERPTVKQINTILFINYWLHTDFDPLLKNQCQLIISENLSKANKIKYYWKENKQ